MLKMFSLFLAQKKKPILILIATLAVVSGAVLLISSRSRSGEIAYGASFSKYHSDELGIPWRETYLALLDEMGVRKLRLSAHWPMVEPKEGTYNFTELDFQMKEAEKRGADVVLAIGQRLPGWPECHIPDWADALPKEERNKKLLAYMEAVIRRYKDSPALRFWQVENEPFLASFGIESCARVDLDLFTRELAMVRALDTEHDIVLTDSGEFGKWLPAYKRSDVFGTTMYLYIWHHGIGPVRYPIPPRFFNLKQNVVELIYGEKPMLLIELGAEPWLKKPIKDATIEEQFDRMGMDKFNEVISFASKTDFSEQYLWGAEWWYYLKLKGYPEHWERAKKLFADP